MYHIASIHPQLAENIYRQIKKRNKYFCLEENKKKGFSSYLNLEVLLNANWSKRLLMQNE